VAKRGGDICHSFLTFSGTYVDQSKIDTWHCMDVTRGSTDDDVAAHSIDDLVVQMLMWHAQGTTRGYTTVTWQVIVHADCIVRANPEVTHGPITGCHVAPQI
jgi:hypothetical protein